MTLQNRRTSTPATRALLAGLVAATTLAGTVPATAADTGDARIALSVGHAGDSWRRAMLEAWGAIAETAARDGVVAAADAFTTETADVQAQAAQLDALVAEGYDAIVVNAASTVDLNDAVLRACAAGVLVVSVDGTVTEPCAWRIATDYRGLGRAQVNMLADRFPEGGHLLEIRGVEGSAADEGIAAGVRASVDAYGMFEIVASVPGGATQEDARDAVAAVLPGLPPVIGVLTQGGDGVGVADPFAAAGREIPVIVLGNRHEELAWWRARAGAEGYDTLSAAPAPGLATLAFWTAQRLLEGVPVPKEIVVPWLRVDRENLETALSLTDHDGVFGESWSRDEARRTIAEAD